jgi:hypothetical protein
MAIFASPQRNLAALTTLLSGIFNDAYLAGLGNLDNWAPSHTKIIDTVKRAVTYIFYGDANPIEEVGENENYRYDDLLGFHLEQTMREFQGGVQISKKDYVDDDLGILNDQVTALATRYSDIWNVLAVEILNNGATTVETYDAVSLYNNAHIIGDGTFDNLLAGTAVFAVDIQTVYQSMLLFPSDKNELRPFNVPTHVVHPTGMIFEVKTALNNAWDGSTTSATENVNQGLVKPIIEPRLTDANDWFAFRSAGAEVPFVGITNKAGSSTNEQLVNMNKPSVGGVVTDKLYYWAIHLIRGLHPTHPHLHCKVVNA